MQSHVEFIKTVICSEEMAVQYLRERSLLDDPEKGVVNCEKCGSVMQKSEISDIVDHILIGRSHIGRAPGKCVYRCVCWWDYCCVLDGCLLSLSL